MMMTSEPHLVPAQIGGESLGMISRSSQRSEGKSEFFFSPNNSLKAEDSELFIKEFGKALKWLLKHYIKMWTMLQKKISKKKQL
jgi:hypothetical protein